MVFEIDVQALPLDRALALRAGGVAALSPSLGQHRVVFAAHHAAVRFLAAAALGVALLATGCEREGETPRAALPDDASQCVENLRAIHAGLVEYTRTRGAPPPGSGVRFFAALVADGVWPADGEHVARLSCPGSTSELRGADMPVDRRFADLANLDEGWSAYAGRDQERAPLGTFPGPGVDALVACDNHAGANHVGVTNALFADGSVVSYELAKEIAAGHLPAGTLFIPVGPDSPIAALRPLRPDPPR